MDASSVTSALSAKLIGRQVARDGGWLPFDRYMALALYAPGLGYYANASRKFGAMPSSGSDFVTAPEMTPLFGRALAVQVARRWTHHRHARGVGVRRRLRRARAQLLQALGDRIDATPSSTCRRACASGSSRRWRPSRTRRWVTNCPSACPAWWSATRCSTRCR
jgi:hypothetical protein